VRIYAAILAAGRGARFGSDKSSAMLGNKPVWKWSVDTFFTHPEIERVMLVTSPDKVDQLSALVGPDVLVIAGGETRQASSKNAVMAAVHADILLIHDAARPFVSPEIISKTITAIKRSGAAGVAMAVVDTIKEIGPNSIKTLNRADLVAMQTPQGARRALLVQAHESVSTDFTDEMAHIEAMGVHPEIVEGESANFKITSPEDLSRARAMLPYPETRTGIGYDIHPFSDDPSRKLFLGGVHFPDHAALDGHSDADVLLHAGCDALLGAAGLGDIGQHFPNTDAQWEGCPSITFLTQVGILLKDNGWRIVNLDMTLVAESPKVMRRAEEIRTAVANALSISPARVSVKATTNEKLGSIGRSEGIAALAVATIVEVR